MLKLKRSMHAFLAITWHCCFTPSFSSFTALTSYSLCLNLFDFFLSETFFCIFCFNFRTSVPFFSVVFKSWLFVKRHLSDITVMFINTSTVLPSKLLTNSSEQACDIAHLGFFILLSKLQILRWTWNIN